MNDSKQALENLENTSKTKEINEFLGQVSFSETKNASALESEYRDPYVTFEQKKRDRQITELLAQYVQCYKNKAKQTVVYRWMIIIPSIVIIIAFAAALVYFAVKIANSGGDLEVSGLAAFITSCVSFVSLVIGLLKIITKYFFPENDEQYITTIVESIQKNDLENKRENAKHCDGCDSEKP